MYNVWSSEIVAESINQFNDGDFGEAEDYEIRDFTNPILVTMVLVIMNTLPTTRKVV